MKESKENLSIRRIGLCWEATRAPRGTRKPQAWAGSPARAGLLRARHQSEKSIVKLTSTKTRIVSYASSAKETFTLNQYISARTGDMQHKRQATAYREMFCIDQALGLKLIVFRERDDHKKLAPSLDYGAKVETTFRMGFKGGLHFLFDDNNPIVVSSIHFDGHEHHGRHIDKDRIIGRLKPDLRPYCQIPKGVRVDDRQAEAQSYDDYQFLQSADLLVGSFRSVLAEKKSQVQADVASPAAELVKKWKAEPARMKNSRWHRAFCISECCLANGQWQFAPLPAKADDRQRQLPLG